MKSILIALLLSLCAYGTSMAAPLVLKCETSKEKYDVKIDLKHRKINIGILTYDINQYNEAYLSAYLRQPIVGGEILIINRVTGIFRRISAYVSYESVEDTATGNGRFGVITTEGHCTKL